MVVVYRTEVESTAGFSTLELETGRIRDPDDDATSRNPGFILCRMYLVRL